MKKRFRSEVLLSQGQDRGRDRPLEEGPMGRLARVLLVDDDRMMRLLESAVIRNIGADAKFASDGREGLERFKETRPDLIVTDMQMPIMNGLEMLREIKRIDPSARAMVVSGGLPLHEENAFYDAGALLILDKPCRMAELERAVRYCLLGLE